MRTAMIGRILAVAASALALAAVAAAQGQKPAEDEAARQRAEIAKVMDEKLRCAQDLLTALSLENFELLAERANTLKRIGSGSLAKVSPNIAYLKYNAEFVSLAEQLERRARTRDLNGATLSYVRLTVNCVECHKYVRDEHILDPRPDRR